jgi:molybdate transport system substrate-binding protein
VLVLALALGGVRAEETVPAGPVTVFAAASLRDVLTEIAAAWAERGGPPVRCQFEASSTLARQLREGAPAAVFVSAAPEWVDVLHPAQRYDWLGNRLVVVVPKDAPDADLASLASLALAGEQVPAGRYARAALAHQGFALPPRVIYGANVRDVLAKVAQGGAAAGIVYATDAAVDPAVRIAYTFPAASHPRIVYTVALLTPAGSGLFDALREPWALAIARRHGFTGVE